MNITTEWWETYLSVMATYTEQMLATFFLGIGLGFVMAGFRR